jgi:hypothetical protein
MHTKTTKYSSAGEGDIEMTVTQDEAGHTTAFTMRAPSEQGPPEQTTLRLDCEYDRLGNWTSCRQLAGQELTQEFRRTISYR